MPAERQFACNSRPRILRSCFHCFLPGSRSLRFRCSGCDDAYYCNVTCQRKAWSVHKLYCTKEIVPPDTMLGRAWVRHNVNEIVDYSMGLWDINRMAERLDSTALLKYIREKSRQTLPAFTLMMIQAPHNFPPYTKVMLEPLSLINSHVESEDVPFLSSALLNQPDLEGVFLVNVGFKIFSYDRSTVPITEFMEVHISTDSLFDNLPIPEAGDQVARWIRKMHLERFEPNGITGDDEDAAVAVENIGTSN